MRRMFPKLTAVFVFGFFLKPDIGIAEFNRSFADSLPEPAGWFTGDIHVHKNCGDGTAVFGKDSLVKMMAVSNLSVISLLADMGNGEVKYAPADLPNVNGKDDTLSTANRLVHWDAEWHWDATYSNFNHQALGGHLVLLGLKEAHQIWDESPYKVLQWARNQGAVTGFAHFEYLKDSFQQNLNCCIPVEYPVEAALGTIDFVSEDVFGITSPNNGNYNSEAVLTAWYKLQNCGFRLSLAAGTDFPCNDLEPLGNLLTYVDVGKKLSYDGWIKGLKTGRTVVSRDGHNEFIDLKVNKTLGPGDELKTGKGKPVTCSVTWTAVKPVSGSIELICNGKVIATQKDSVGPGKSASLTFTLPVKGSSWISARCVGPSSGHLLQTGAVYVTVANKPIRASAEDARYFMDWIDRVLANTKSTAPWSRYFTHDQEIVFARYRKARNIFEKIYHESVAR